MNFKKQNATLIFLCIMLICTTSYVIYLGKNNLATETAKAMKQKKSNPIPTTPPKKVTPTEDVNLTDADNGVPVLAYTTINANNVTPENFKLQMHYLKDNGYSTLTLDDLYEYLSNAKKIPLKSVVITIDNGYSSIFRYAYPVLKELKFNATVFVTSGSIDTNDYLKSKELIELSNNSIDIQSNGTKSQLLSSLSQADQNLSFKDSIVKIKNITSKDVKYFAYPQGKCTDLTKKLAKDSGYIMAFNFSNKLADKKDNLFNIDRVFINSTDTIDSFTEKMTKSKKN